ncbi:MULTISPECIES: DUF2946 domain-containing protein [Burkholderia]|uniref:DUF2946 domain-containing protein n=1 Tax=Burkholderia savannae TaxID=1637837 RepID=A0ABR5TBI8_9BURK|nr:MULTISPECIES: DUF2946 domain-containing protein [Burkholderia]AOJ68067.1 hypothetical protein WS78_04340 [Burkholderia savannae]AOJ80140.1 hypothetical protein WS86_05545 [Burkholderia savannae]KVG40450.1 hypothetical protein WS77_18100 [Burkholderia sp. MSMB0265]KVG84610.1 hypothetical protein WS81_05205 [Burkholderia sp. MSMB2040]KVG90178.1 hypothetical protein WS82_18770 [Burkholderia sp. MSMB2041]
MKRSTRWMSLVWLALVLNVLSPVIGYARAASNAADAPFALELCSAAGAKRIVGAGETRKDDGALAHVAHCVYCPGFAANVALGSSAPVLPCFVRAFAYASRVERPAVFFRRGVRIAQPRAPPETVPV